jgi:hypothetical protein
MAQLSELSCRQAQKMMQMLLDRRWTKPVPPRLQDHLEECQSCRSFLPLFDYEAASVISEPAPDFSDRIITMLKRERSRQPRLLRRVLAASAAAVIAMTVLASYFLVPGPNPKKNVPELLPMWQTAKREIEHVPERLQSWRPPYIDLSAALPEFQLPIPSDPLAGTIPSVQALGTTLQAAIEPIQMPAKEAYEKVKMIIHDPNVKKWLDSVTNGAM